MYAMHENETSATIKRTDMAPVSQLAPTDEECTNRNQCSHPGENIEAYLCFGLHHWTGHEDDLDFNSSVWRRFVASRAKSNESTQRLIVFNLR